MPGGGGSPPGRTAPQTNALSSNGLGRERVSKIQRARILAAMAQVCAERGAANVTVAHVVTRSGVSRRTFYEQFTDREDCFLAAFDDALASAQGFVLDAYDPRLKWIDGIRVGLTALLEFLEVEHDAARLLIVESLGAGAKALERRRRALAQLVAVIDEGRASAKAGGTPPPLAAEGVVGGVASVLHSRLVDGGGPLLDLAGPLMSMIALPYLGASAARRELGRPLPARPASRRAIPVDPLRDVEMRLTYRTVCVLSSVAANPGSSNREIGSAAAIGDQGQISKLLTRLCRLGLIANVGAGQARGAPNAWTLTEKGIEIEAAIGGRVG